MYAILKTGGKQYKVSEGDVIYVEKLGVEDGATVTFDEVLAVGEGDSLTVGAPYVSGAAVTGTVEKTGKGKKINIFKMKPKKGYRKRQGHRQPYTKVTIARSTPKRHDPRHLLPHRAKRPAFRRRPGRPRGLRGGRGGHRMCGDLQRGHADACLAV